MREYNTKITIKNVYNGPMSCNGWHSVYIIMMMQQMTMLFWQNILYVYRFIFGFLCIIAF